MIPNKGSPELRKKATVLGVIAFALTLAGLLILTRDSIFSMVIGCVAGFGTFDLTLVLGNESTKESDI